MKALIHVAACGALALGLLGFTGCEDNSRPLPKGENGSTAGGNGAFGESPERPGSYDTVTHAPATQPSSGDVAR